MTQIQYINSIVLKANPYTIPPYFQPSKPWTSGLRCWQIRSSSIQGIRKYLSYSKSFLYWMDFSFNSVLGKKRSPCSFKITISTGDHGLLADFSVIKILKCNRSLGSRNGPNHKMSKRGTQSHSWDEGYIYQRKPTYCMCRNLISANSRTLLMWP